MAPKQVTMIPTPRTSSSDQYTPTFDPPPSSASAPLQAQNPANTRSKRNSMLDYFRAKRQPKDKGKEKEEEHTPTATTTATETLSKSELKGKQRAADVHDEPILNAEDEAFLARIVSEPEGPRPPLPERPGASTAKSTDAQVVLMQGADTVPLPDAPETPESDVARAIEGETSEDSNRLKPKANRFSWLRRSSSRSTARKETAASLSSAAESIKSPKPADAKSNADGQVAPAEATKEEDEMASVLEQLNLSAVNNRVFSFSDESKSLLKQFTLVLKDLVNGVPTAYHDLESLLTNSDQQLQKGYKSLPPFLQELIEKLPEKFGKSLGPEFLAAAAEKQGVKSGWASHGASAAEKLGMKIKVPSLKDLVTKQGTLVALLRTVFQALRARFPAFLGMNVLWSLALFVLLFIFWYCYKRGREVRLEKEREVTEQEMQAISERVIADPAWEPPAGWSAEGGTTLLTRAPEGASLEEVSAGIGLREESEAGTYAPEGSLGRALKEEAEEEKRKKQDRELPESVAANI